MGKKKKCDFTKDALNTTAVLNTNLPSEHSVIQKPDPKSRTSKHKPDPLTQFLRQSRNFCIKPKLGKAPHCIATQHLRDNDNCGIVVDRLDIAVGLMCCDVSSTHDMHFSQVRMNSVRNKTLFDVLGATSTVPSGDNPSHRPKSPDVHLLPHDDHSLSDDPGDDDLPHDEEESLDDDFSDLHACADERSTATADVPLDNDSSDSCVSADERFPAAPAARDHPPSASCQLSSKLLLGCQVPHSFKTRL